MSSLETEKKKMFQIYFNSNLKEQLDFKNKSSFTLFRLVMRGF